MIDRAAYRQTFIDAWRRARAGLPLEPLEARIAAVIAAHPEYQPLLEGSDRLLERDWLPEQGQTNPFLHLALHLTLLEQLSIDQPAGIRALHARLLRVTGDAHEAEHGILDCLAAALWTLQRDPRPFSADAYLQCIRERIG